MRELAERYGWINRAMPANQLSNFVSSLAHRISNFPAAGRAIVKERINAISLPPVEEIRRDSELFLRACRRVSFRREPKLQWSMASRPGAWNWILPGY